MEYRLDLTTLSCEMPYLDITDFTKLTYQSSDKGATKILSSRDSRSTGTYLLAFVSRLVRFSLKGSILYSVFAASPSTSLLLSCWENVVVVMTLSSCSYSKCFLFVTNNSSKSKSSYSISTIV